MGAVIEDEGFSVSDQNATHRDWLNDENGHGTSVAGIIAARNGGGRGIVGVARGEQQSRPPDVPRGSLQLTLQIKDFQMYTSTGSNAFVQGNCLYIACQVSAS